MNGPTGNVVGMTSQTIVVHVLGRMSQHACQVLPLKNVKKVIKAGQLCH
jgi:hypothetical protein